MTSPGCGWMSAWKSAPKDPARNHLVLEHQTVDATTPLQLLVGVVLGGVGHRPEDHRNARRASTLRQACQLGYHVVLLHRRLGHLPRSALLVQEVVDRVDHEQRRARRVE